MTAPRLASRGPVLSIADAAAHAGISKRSMQRLFAERAFPVVSQTAQRRGVWLADLEAYLLSRTDRAAS